MLRPRRESLHSDGITDQKSLQRTSATKSPTLRTQSHISRDPKSVGGFNRSAQHLLIYEVRRCAMVTSRIWFTAAQKAELWERWKNGQSAAAISRALERKNKTGVERIVVLHGGIGPAPRRRALAALRFEEREEISRAISVGRSIRQIATRRVDRGISSIWSLSASGPPRLRIALCRGIGKETFLPERTTRTSLPSSSAIPASRCSSRSPARTRRLLLLRLPSTSASCLRSCDAP